MRIKTTLRRLAALTAVVALAFSLASPALAVDAEDSFVLVMNVAPASFLPGATGVLAISAKNITEDDISNVSVTLSLPVIFIPGQSTLTVDGSSNTISWKGDGNNYTANIGKVPAGQSAVLAVSFFVNVLSPMGMYTCSAGVSYPDADGSASASASIIVMPANPKPPVPPTPEKKELINVPDRFTDDNGHWAERFIDVLADNGTINGTGTDTFEPEVGLTRAMVVQILYNLYGENEVVSGGQFTDLTQDWYVNAINWAVKKGFASGDTSTTFAPDRLATREETVVMLDKMAALREKTIAATTQKWDFNDNSAISPSAVDAVYRFQAGGIVKGDDLGNFNPTSSIKRAEFAKIMCLYLDAMDELAYEISSLK